MKDRREESMLSNRLWVYWKSLGGIKLQVLCLIMRPAKTAEQP